MCREPQGGLESGKPRWHRLWVRSGECGGWAGSPSAAGKQEGPRPMQPGEACRSGVDIWMPCFPDASSNLSAMVGEVGFVNIALKHSVDRKQMPCVFISVSI